MTDKTRKRVFSLLGAPLSNQYDWDAVRPSDGAVIMQVSNAEAAEPGAWPDRIPILDPDAAVQKHYLPIQKARHRTRQEHLLRVWDGAAPRYVIFAATDFDYKSGRERTRSISEHNVHRVLEFSIASRKMPERYKDDNVYEGATYARIDPTPMDPTKV